MDQFGHFLGNKQHDSQVFALSDQSIKFVAGSLHFTNRVVLILLGLRIVNAVIVETHPGKVAFGAAASIAAESHESQW
jgi:hypothetical protein